MMSSVSGNVGGGMSQQPQMNTEAPDVRTAGSERSGQGYARQPVQYRVATRPLICPPVPTLQVILPHGTQIGAKGPAIGENRKAMLKGARAIIQYLKSDPRDRVSPEVREQYAAPGDQMETTQSR